MAEVWGQRSLLGVGVVLAWLVLFHLLVNIWLLCVFTSLLLVLWGWLGSQTVLESNSVIHLERFITWEQIPKSEKDENDLDQEIHNTVKKIIRDFVTSWYSTVSSESAFETEIEEAMISMAMGLKLRARTADRKELTQRVLDLFGCHLQDYMKAKELVTEQQVSLRANESSENEQLWKAYSSISSPHLAVTSETVEVNYVRAVADLLLHVLVPSPHLETRTGRFVVGELITCNVLLPLVAKLSDPDWLNLLILKIFVSQPPETTESPNSSPLLPSPPDDPEVAPAWQAAHVPQENSDVPAQRAEAEKINHTETATPAADDVPDSAEADFPQHNAEEDETVRPFLRRYTRGSKSNPFYQENDSDPDSPLADFKRSSSDSLVMIGQDDGLDDSRKDCATSVETNYGLDLEDVCHSPVDGQTKFLLSSESEEQTNGCVLPSLSTAERDSSISRIRSLDREGSSPSIIATRGLLIGAEQTGVMNPNELSVVSTLQCCSSVPTFSFEPLSSPEGPVIIQNLRITGTITAKEHRGTGSHPYTLYTIKYETAMACENPASIQAGFEDAETVQTGCENPSSAQSVAYHTVNRRYSEFLNLQTRLEEKTELRKLIKGVKGPKKIFPDMPFGNMDSDKIEARKGLLETFLKQLCGIPEIANSEEMQEFLALNTDARIAFVKKPFIVSRIDKIVVNAIVDTLKTAFPRSEPQSPTEDNETEVDGGKIGADKKTRSRLKFSSKNVPCMNGSDVRPPVLFSMEEASTMFNGMSLGYLQDFINEQEKQTMKDETERGTCAGLREFGGHLDHRKSRERGLGFGSEMALAEVALNILCLLMKQQWSWLCMENIQKTIRLVFGTLINRWLDVSVSNLTCTRYWVVYLQVIQEAVWPGGALPTAPVFERSQQQKDDTKQQALRCLMRLVPDLVSDVLGSEKYRLSWQTALDSFQDPHINRHLVYCIFDLLLEFLVPEIPEENFQRSLLQTLCKNPEKLLA
ncbi:sorting nexin-19 [Maylandia zebra]|uniref:Sorting nexin 19 n=2 Tax=Haplochromini TaxID=319058 RepID=A0A3P9CTY8_9CICH|nr:sorting nexin-19 [Maylandia zebra]XP_014263214.1 sorting nexin-19 [Maylandia zebra]XP_014263215.1 sorting nexin-19 [Maylandia zebra]XP_024660570.1 sorting nexin-19 [Maylandia zebra]XP_026047100.1 sorting nexin-19-like isoform X1 [Astatotilapia calliptera]XP_026047101.1 sorting nexin-19-like isoform X1 [Astatotilapia calliptera]